MQKNKEITEAIISWNELFEWTAGECKTVEEGIKIYVLLDKILKILKAHPKYSDIDGDYEETWKFFQKLSESKQNKNDTNN